MRERLAILLISTAGVMLMLAGGVTLSAGRAGMSQTESDKPKTVLNGVFTLAQAERGRKAYEALCSSCHMPEPSTTGVPPLEGQKFMDNWREDSVNSLFNYIRNRMPPKASPRLSEETSVDIVAHLLALNMFPTGSRELTANALGSIQLVGKDGPAPLPKFALVEVVGCLVEGPSDTWMLSKVAGPIRTHSEEGAATNAEWQAIVTRPLGTDIFRLVYIDSLRHLFYPEGHVGHKVHAKGYLLQNDKGLGLSVTWLEGITPTCA